MSFLIQSLLLAGEPGSLIYNLVLLAVLGWAASMAARQWRRTREALEARLAVVVSGLLLLRLLMFGVFLLGAASILDPLLSIPPLARAASVLNTILILLLLAFPDPHRPADLAAAGLALLTPLAARVAWSYWRQAVAAGAAFYNGSPQEPIWEIVQLGGLFAGLALVSARRKADWPLGLSLLTVLLIGHIIHYLFPLAGTNVPGAVHLAEIVAYPILAVMIYRRARPPGVEGEDAAPAESEPFPVVANELESVSWVVQRLEQRQAAATPGSATASASPGAGGGVSLAALRAALVEAQTRLAETERRLAEALQEHAAENGGNHARETPLGAGLSLAAGVSVASCPRLGLSTDPNTQHIFASPDNRCYALTPPAQITLIHQGTYCLTDGYERCPVFSGRNVPSKSPIG